MPDKREVKCVLPEKVFKEHGCFYSSRNLEGKRFCGNVCAIALIKRCSELKRENDQLKKKLEEFQSEV